MKRVRIEAFKKGLVHKNGRFVRFLSEGVHWLKFSEVVTIYDMSKPFFAHRDLAVMPEQVIEKEIHLIDVKDNEIAIRFENEVFAEVLTAGRHAYWKGFINYLFVRVDLNSVHVNGSIDKAVLTRREVLHFIRVHEVLSFEKGLLFIDGKFSQMLEAGTYFFWKSAVPVIVLHADLRQLQMEVSGQDILTRDKAAIRINFFAQYKVTDVIKALVDNKEYEKQLYVLLQLALREYVGSLTLDELLEKKEKISAFIQESVNEAAQGLGVTVLSSGIRDIILPGEVKDIMNQVLIAEKKAQANTIMRREETASTRSLLNTAKLMEENSMLLKLKEMEYVEKIADKINNISVSGGNLVVDQLREIFVPRK